MMKILQLRQLITRCVCANASHRPDVWEVLDVAEEMNAHYSVSRRFFDSVERIGCNIFFNCYVSAAF